jgi:hypothetical protein
MAAGCSGGAAIYGHFERVCQTKNKGKEMHDVSKFHGAVQGAG